MLRKVHADHLPTLKQSIIISLMASTVKNTVMTEEIAKKQLYCIIKIDVGVFGACTLIIGVVIGL